MLIDQKCFPYTMPVVWHSPDEYPNLQNNLADWLLNTGSLTERLQALTTTFRVNLLGQNSAPLDSSELELLSNSCNKDWQVREVVLQGEVEEISKDWVFARSVLPDLLCKSTWANLGSQPLGQRIFNDTSFVRSEFEIGKLLYHPLTGEKFGVQNPCWARRSRFQIGEHMLLVAEAFLPDSPCYL
ncbi:chorismate--pyruvate lyase family protein [Glaciecola petra]|uniref:Probable chorismate pyruvate-lyase n=1 Tax=Glaciecola petra TaxID=3075602 RepID=A0ABU2ZUX5_9ALTE|nr:chorismate lyase [Aestuariibacter sp. P117]MDT0596446.1 chorismate lyase [Aestuariibacter sp. P117]